jgi:hypothetical protein
MWRISKLLLLLLLLSSGCGRDTPTQPQVHRRAIRNAETYRMMQDCRPHHGIQEITAVSDESSDGDGGIDYFLVVCRDGSGPFKEISDGHRKVYN